ncbi:ABC transporter permease [Chitinophaga sedimenti]|uniref:ABC transporter permease n=1 Tax=Chitinophaga sedimenti TaxID=2033606 RepID=UPI002003124D|nr:FtsX-like permease family protein [Chitinophaga sedimenti]MCK7558875.1 ABC transporter permease [Chitinophaga sedimenti]
MVQIKYADTHYADIYQLQFVAGRNLQPSDTMREIVINESMAREAGFTRPAEAVGATMKLWDQQVPVAGVVRDFDAQSIKAGARPLVICSEASTYYSYDLLLEPGGAAVWQPAIQQITALAKTTFPDKQFDIKFFDDEVAAFYKYEQELSALLSWSMALMVLLSCLGLLGLSIHATTQRTREVGIRKVMGASVAGIVAMFTKDVIKLIAIALLIAAPVAWYAMHTWLQGYAFRVPIQWWVFAAAGAGAILVGLLTVSVHSLKAALMNPVRSLRTE